MFRHVTEFSRSSFPKLLSTRTKTKRSKPSPKFASDFKQADAELLKVSFQPASFKDVIPSLGGSAPAEYILPEIDRDKIVQPSFKVDDLDVSNRVKTFNKMRDVVQNETVATGTNESITETLVDDLLRIVDLNVWPLKIINHSLCRIMIEEKPYVSADLEFVVANRKLNMVAVEDKHIKNIYSPSGFGETQIAANIIACGDENIRATNDEKAINETIFAMRVLSTYVTFYKAEIPAGYWTELGKGLPETKVIVKRWPGENAKRNDLDLVEPSGRETVLVALANIRNSLLSNEQPAKKNRDG